MATSAYRADITLNEVLRGTATPHLWLHVGAPGAAGTGNPARRGGDTQNVIRKAIPDFDAPENHPTNDERRCLGSGANITWDGTEIDSGQDITHFSIWDGDDASTPDVEFIAAVTDSPRHVGSDGVVITPAEIEAAIEVFAKP